jgi:hypothetical protein
VRVVCSDPAIKSALDKVTAGSSEEYAVFGYVPKTAKLKVVAEGSGWDDMSEEMVRQCFGLSSSPTDSFVSVLPLLLFQYYFLLRMIISSSFYETRLIF